MDKIVVALIGGPQIDDQGICGVYDDTWSAMRAVEVYFLERYPDDPSSHRKWILQGSIIRYVDASSETVLGAIAQLEMNQKEYVSMV